MEIEFTSSVDILFATGVFVCGIVAAFLTGRFVENMHERKIRKENSQTYEINWLTYDLAVISDLLDKKGDETDQKQNVRLLKKRLIQFGRQHVHITCKEIAYSIKAEGFAAIKKYEQADEYWQLAMQIVSSPDYSFTAFRYEIQRRYARYLYTRKPCQGYEAYKVLVEEILRLIPADYINPDDKTDAFSALQYRRGIALRDEAIITLYDWIKSHRNRINSFDAPATSYIFETARQFNDPVLAEKIKGYA